MRYILLLAIVSAAVLIPVLHGSTPVASASDHDTEGPPPDDLGILLTDMFAAAADVLAAHQQQTANESYLGSAARSHRLQSAILQAPDVTLRRGARPLIEGWILDDD